MSQELYVLLQERAALGRIRFPVALAVGGAVFGAQVGLVALSIFLGQTHGEAPAPRKVTWVTLPGAAATGPSGGSGPQVQGDTGQRIRRVEDVAPKVTERPAGRIPDAVGNTKPSPPIKGTNPDAASKGKSADFSKGKTAAANPKIGAAGQGDGSGIGVGVPIPGLRASGASDGGTGLVGGLDQSNFPYAWYVQNMQNTIIRNWSRTTNAQGRVGIYFRILKDGTLEGWKVESPSNNYAFDQSALNAVRRTGHVPPLPDDFQGNELGVHFWFTYLGN